VEQGKLGQQTAQQTKNEIRFAVLQIIWQIKKK
jgi:hypothetical protein